VSRGLPRRRLAVLLTPLPHIITSSSDSRPTRINTDSQGQSTHVFGLAFLLGIELTPRIRGWKELKIVQSRRDGTNRIASCNPLRIAFASCSHRPTSSILVRQPLAEYLDGHRRHEPAPERGSARRSTTPASSWLSLPSHSDSGGNSAKQSTCPRRNCRPPDRIRSRTKTCINQCHRAPYYCEMCPLLNVILGKTLASSKPDASQDSVIFI
jgi:hypothetical protein